jgi:hypothetical protein
MIRPPPPLAPTLACAAPRHHCLGRAMAPQPSTSQPVGSARPRLEPPPHAAGAAIPLNPRVLPPWSCGARHRSLVCRRRRRQRRTGPGPGSEPSSPRQVNRHPPATAAASGRGCTGKLSSVDDLSVARKAWPIVLAGADPNKWRTADWMFQRSKIWGGEERMMWHSETHELERSIGKLLKQIVF